MARAFSGTAQWISGSGVPGNVGDGIRSVALWVRTSNNATRQFIYLEGDDSATYSRFALEIISTTFKFTWNIRSSNFQGTTTPTNDTWYHFAITYTNGAYVLYVNGVQENSGAPPTLATTTTNFEIGRYHGGSLYLVGQAAEVAKWNVVLTAAEAVSLAKGFSPRSIRPQSLVFYAPLVRNVQDERAALALTDNGPTTATDHPRIYA